KDKERLGEVKPLPHPPHHLPEDEKQALCPDQVAPVRQAASPTRSPFGQVVGWVRQWFDLT
ncbi:MAG: hypothetical protein AAFO87_18010, partial [Cyanobacteria bacterium J06607_6]